MMTSAQDEQRDRRETLQNDVRVRDQGATFLGFTHSEVGGRFKVESKEYIVGSEPFPKYPALPASSPWSGNDPVPDEPPLSRPEQSSAVFPAPALPNPTAPSDPLDVERSGLGSSSPQRFAEQPSGLSQHRLDVGVLGAGGAKFQRRL
jgi:hypothetical protein